MRSREEKNLEGQAGAFVGNAASQNVQMGTDTAIDSMRELLYKAGKISKVGFEQSKGNLFEYIEAAKLQTNMANCGERFDRNPVMIWRQVGEDTAGIRHRMTSVCRGMAET